MLLSPLGTVKPAAPRLEACRVADPEPGGEDGALPTIGLPGTVIAPPAVVAIATEALSVELSADLLLPHAA